MYMYIPSPTKERIEERRKILWFIRNNEVPTNGDLDFGNLGFI